MNKINNNYYNGYRKDIIALLDKNISTLLDVGCGYGNTSKSIKDQFGLTRVDGIEVEPNAFQTAKENLDHVYQINLNSPNPLSELNFSQYDCILFLDVLEHLLNPEIVLKDSLNYLNNTGKIIVSLPNISHHSALFPLLFKNKWEYTDSGILDKTHLRFFTLKSMKQLIQNSGYKILHIQVNKSFSKKLRYFNILSFNLLERFSHFQYIFICQKA